MFKQREPPPPATIDSDSNRYRRSYLACLAIIGILVLGDAAVSHLILKRADHDAQVIDKAGRQRMLSQRISKAAFRYESSPDDSLETLAELDAAISEFTDNHHALCSGNANLGIPAPTNQFLIDAYDRLASSHEEIRQSALVLLESPETDVMRTAVQRILSAERRFLPEMQATVVLHKEVAARHLKSLRRLRSCLLFLVVLVLPAMSLLIFEPTIRILRSRRVEQDEINRELERLAEVASRTTNAVIFTDADRLITWVNAGFTRLTGYTRDEALGQSPGKMLQCPRSEPEMVEKMRDALNAGKGFRGIIRNRGKSGREYWVDLDIQPRYHEDGSLVGFVAVESDITSQVEHGRRVEAIITASGVGTWELDLQRNEVIVNQRVQSMLGYEHGELPLNRAEWANLVHPDDQPRIGELLKKHFAGRSELFRSEHRMRRRDGSWMWVLSAGKVTHRDFEGNPMEVAGIHVDIDDHKILEKRLRTARGQAKAATEAKSHFLARMSHEIRTPLSAILGFVNLLKDAELTADQRAEYVTAIRSNGEHLLGLINDVLDLSKIEAGKLNVEHVPCSVASVIRNIATLMRLEASEKGLDFRVESGSPLPESVYSDPLRLRQILFNLIANAVKFTEQGSVVVTSSLLNIGETEWIEVEVSDSGIGVPPDKVDSLFKPFEQGDQTITRRFGGSGLGLAVSRSLAESMGGTINVDSEVDRGSRFSLRLPVIRVPSTSISDAPDASSNSEAVSAQDDQESLQGVRVLLVEDSPDIRYLTRHYLRRAGAEVVEAENGEDALRCVCDAPGEVNLVLMDVQMPVMDGLAATRSLRQIGVQIPIIALTANVMQKDRARCMSAGFDDFLPKPIDAVDLIAVCNRWISRKAETPN